MTNLTLGERIRRIRKGLKLNQSEFAKLLGFKFPTSVSKYEDNTRVPEKDKLVKIAELGKISLDELLTGVPPVGQSAEEESGKDVAGDDEFVTIPSFADRISAGQGLIPANNIEIRIAFRRDWIQKKGDPKKMSIIRVSGDSMEPTLMPDDLVLINHGHNHIDPQGGIYAVTVDDHIMIKRIQVVYPSGRIKVISDNTRYDSAEVDFDQVKINGKLIWFGREM